MPDDSPTIDADIIRAAYAEKVKDAFIVFAENLAVGQGEKSCKERFLRSLDMVKKARDLALEAVSGADAGEPPAASEEAAPNSTEAAADALSAADRAMIEQAVGGTTGAARPALREPIRSR
jgi:hypothetical protein